MQKVLIASHGRTASGIASTLSLFLPNSNVTYIDAYVDENNTNYESDISSFLNSLDDNDSALIFTDIYGGSVNQKVIDLVLRHKNVDKIRIISNVNVPVVIELLAREDSLSEDGIKDMMENSKPVLIVPNKLISKEAKNVSDDEFFG